jgi:hypothetical protein
MYNYGFLRPSPKNLIFLLLFLLQKFEFRLFPPFFFSLCVDSLVRGSVGGGEKRRRKTLKEGLDGEGMWLHL